MPKLTADQAYEKFVELEKKGDVNELVDLMVDCYESPEALQGADRFYNEFAKSVKEAAGPDKAKKEKLMMDWLDKVFMVDAQTRLDAGIRMADYEQKIRAGEVPDTELIKEQKSKVKAIAHDLVHCTPLGNRYMATNHARMALLNALRMNKVISGELSNQMQQKKPMECTLRLAKERGMEEKAAKDYAVRAESFEKSAEKYNFVVKDNFKDGEYPFEKIPEEIKELKNASLEELEQKVTKNQKEIDELLQYEQAALKTKQGAQSLLSELDAIKKEGHENSIEYEEMRGALENIGNVGSGMIWKRGDMHVTNWDYSSKIIDKGLQQLQTTAETYESTHRKPGGQFGKDRRDLSTRIKEFAIQQKQLLAEAKPSINEAVIGGLKRHNEQMDMIAKEQVRRGLKPKDYKWEAVKPATQNQHNDFMEEKLKNQSKLEEAILTARKSNKKVHMGSSEFDRSIKAMQELAKVHKEWVAVSDSKDKVLQRQKLEELLKKTEEANKAAKQYLDRKQRQGLVSESGRLSEGVDERTGERIKLMQDACQYDIKQIGDEAKITLRELNMPNPQQARAKYEEQIKTSKGSHKLAAQGALGAVNILTRLSDSNNGVLTGQDVAKARSAIAGLVYNEFLRNARIKPQPKNVENYLEQVKTLSNSEEFKKCIPQEITPETLKNLIENEQAVSVLATQITQEKSKHLEQPDAPKVSAPEKKTDQPQQEFNLSI